MQGKSKARKEMELCVQHCVRQTQKGSACHLNIFGLFPHFESVRFCIRNVLFAVARVNTRLRIHPSARQNLFSRFEFVVHLLFICPQYSFTTAIYITLVEMCSRLLSNLAAFIDFV